MFITTLQVVLAQFACAYKAWTNQQMYARSKRRSEQKSVEHIPGQTEGTVCHINMNTLQDDSINIYIIKLKLFNIYEAHKGSNFISYSWQTLLLGITSDELLQIAKRIRILL